MSDTKILLPDLKYLQVIQWLTESSPTKSIPLQVIKELSDTKLGYFSNLARIHNLAGFGIRIESITRLMQHLGDAALLKLFGTVDVSREIRDSANVKIKEELVRIKASGGYMHLANSEAIEVSATHIDLLAQERKEVADGLTAMMEGMITSGWTAFEVLATDLWEAAINAHPRGLAGLRGSAKRINKILGAAKTSEPDAFVSGADGPSKGILISDVHRVTNGSFDLSDKWGTLLKQSFKFSTLSGIREAYSKAFDRNYLAIDACLADKSLNALALVRNLLVHKSGVADLDYIDKQPDAPNAPSLYFGVRMQPNGELVESLLAPALECGSRLMAAVNEWLVNARLEDEKDAGQ